MNPTDETNLYLHPKLERGKTALLERLASELATERQKAIAAIEKAIADLSRLQPEGPPGTAEKLIERFKSALIEIKAIDPAQWPNGGDFEAIGRRLAQLNELPQAYLLLSKAGALKKSAAT